MKRPIEEMIERSSLGTPEATELRATADPSTVDRVLARADELALDELVDFLRGSIGAQMIVRELRRVDAESANAGAADFWGGWLYARLREARTKGNSD
jgi:hypothetical protein